MNKSEITQERCAGTGAVKRPPLPKGTIGISDPLLQCPGCVDCEPEPSDDLHSELTALREAKDEERKKLRAVYDHFRTDREISLANEKQLLGEIYAQKEAHDKAEAEVDRQRRHASAARKNHKEEVERLNVAIENYVALTRLLDEHPEDWGDQEWCECKLCLSYCDE